MSTRENIVAALQALGGSANVRAIYDHMQQADTLPSGKTPRNTIRCELRRSKDFESRMRGQWHLSSRSKKSKVGAIERFFDAHHEGTVQQVVGWVRDNGGRHEELTPHEAANLMRRRSLNVECVQLAGQPSVWRRS